MDIIENKEREQFIEKLRDTARLFDELDGIDSEGMVIGFEDRSALGKLKRKNDTMLKKLVGREFTVAIVGLEKAGKSTLGNALIKQNILPAEDERCTFTKTEIRSGESDEVEIFFFTQEEFAKRLQDMFDAVEYEGEPNLTAFDNYWEGVDTSSNLYQTHGEKTVKDIRKILDGLKTIKELLGREPIKLTEEDDRESIAKLYITGITGYQEKLGENGEVSKVAIRDSHPYAVKNIIIRSTQLRDMENIVLHDVPGFDSPTKLHKDQTQEMLKLADAIILVNNSGTNPNLTGSQLDILRSVEDEDQVKLYRKAFVFGNRIDLSPSKEKANDRKAILEEESEKTYLLVSPNKGRVLIGSARAYLEKLGLLNTTECMDKLDSWNMPYGVDELRNKLQEYYDKDRFVILKERANKTLKEIEDFLLGILQKYPLETLEDEDPGHDISDDISYKIDKVFNVLTERINKEYKVQIESERVFSNVLDENLEDIFPKNDVLEVLEEVDYNIYKDSNSIYDIDKLNGMLREKLQVRFINRMVQQVATITDDRMQIIRAKWVDCFLDAIEAEYKSDELKKSVDELFSEYLNENISRCHLNVLIERFATPLVEALILLPYASPTRKEKITEIMPDLANLSQYYRQNDKELAMCIQEKGSKPITYLITKILCHIDIDEYFNEEKFKDDNSRMVLWDRTSRLKDKEDMINILNEDIDILIDITHKSLLDAIGLEKAFVRVFSKNISIICGGLADGGGRKKKAKWLNEYTKKVRPSEFIERDRKRERNQKIKDIVLAINKVMEMWKQNG